MKTEREVVYNVSSVYKICPVCGNGFKVDVIYPFKGMPHLPRDYKCEKCKSKLRIVDNKSFRSAV